MMRTEPNGAVLATTIIMSRITTALILVSACAAANAQSFSFNFSEVASTKPFNMQSVNDRGDVFGFVLNADGTQTGSIYNATSGFKSIALGSNDQAVSKVTAGGFVYSRDSSSFDASPIYRTMAGGAKTAIDFTNGGALTLGSEISNAMVSDDDRIMFQSNGKAYQWSAATGTQQIGVGLGLVGFGNAGSLIVNTNSGLEKITAGGNHQAIVAPGNAAGMGTLFGYRELASGTQVYSLLKSSSLGGTSIKTYTDYIVPAGQSLGYSVIRTEEQQGMFLSTDGSSILGLNQNGFAVTMGAGFQPLINNQSSFEVKDRNGVMRSGVLIDGIDGSSGYAIGKGSSFGLGSDVNVIGRYEGTSSAVPEPASLAVLGVGVLGLCRKKANSTRK